MRLPLAAVTGDAGLVVDKRQLLADKPVEEGGFSDVGPADDGDSERHGPLHSELGAPRQGRAGDQRVLLAATRPSKVSARWRSPAGACKSTTIWSSHRPAASKSSALKAA